MKESEEKMWFRILDRFSDIKKDKIFALRMIILLFIFFFTMYIYLIISKADYYVMSIWIVSISIIISIVIFTTGLLISIYQRYGLVKYEEEIKYLLKEINENIKKLIEKNKVGK